MISAIGIPRRLLLLSSALALGACADEVTSASETSASGAAGSMAAPSAAVQELIPRECQGFPLKGLKYSPGGTVLPNKCKPFDAQTNNPYAVQCVAAYPAYRTPYAGDELCILPPPPDKGVQFGVHALPADDYWAKMWAGDFDHYTDSDRMKPYEVAPGAEVTQNYVARSYTPTTHESRFFYRYNFRGRPGSHHSVAQFTSGPVLSDTWMENVLDGKIDQNGGTLASVQRAYTDVPQGTLELPPDEEGIGRAIPGDAGSHLNLHYFNLSTERPILREQWINVWYLEREPTRKSVESFIITKIDYPAGEVFENTYAAIAKQPTRLLSMFGHRHAWTTRFNAWLERVDGKKEPIYDSYSWEDMPTFQFSRDTRNPVPDEGARTDGAASGVIELQAGDKIYFTCHVDTTESRAREINLAQPKSALHYADQAVDGEMCVLGTVTTDTTLESIGGKDLFPPSN